MTYVGFGRWQKCIQCFMPKSEERGALLVCGYPSLPVKVYSEPFNLNYADTQQMVKKVSSDR